MTHGLRAALSTRITALEHLGAFARPLGVRLLVENLLSESTTPEHLVIILEMGRLNDIGVCLDLGHAHVTVGVAEAIGTLGARIASVHVHDNHGLKDEHLWPGDGTIDWPARLMHSGSSRLLPPWCWKSARTWAKHHSQFPPRSSGLSRDLREIPARSGIRRLSTPWAQITRPSEKLMYVGQAEF